VKKRFQPKFNIKKGDDVVVIAGDNKDRTQPRKVLAVYPQEGLILVEGVNIVTKHQKPSASNPQGGIVKIEAKIKEIFETGKLSAVRRAKESNPLELYDQLLEIYGVGPIKAKELIEDFDVDVLFV
jgi:ribosomal protein L24